mmetsp:Transcript_8077/g.14148  ORF Transcript_8077/g.14148 Transcript_8077/m.14148 type:complete len:332 (-) Transcript_8077:225-1220(-)
MPRPKTAVIVGATNGIGKGIACRLAREGFQIIAVGREKEGRKNEVLGFLEKCSASSSSIIEGSEENKECSPIQHEFRPCNAFELAQVKTCAQDIVRDYSGENKGIDALVMTHGMATIQNFTPTSEGNDEKLTLHYWSRAAFAVSLLPALRQPSVMPGGPVVMTILSGGVHSPYAKYTNDPELKKNYSVANAANFAGYYTDLFFDRMARDEGNESINFIHAAPGIVASNWGTEMPLWLRVPIRGMQKAIGKSPQKCADFMVRPILQCAKGSIALDLPMQPEESSLQSSKNGLYILNEDATSGKLTKGHTVEAMDSVWDTTKDVLGRAGVDLN